MCGALQGKGKADGNLGRVLLPLSSLSGWGLVAVGALMVMHVLGFNIQPLLTVGGVGGLAFGFGAQAVTSNAISGLNLFLTRPFVVGGVHTPRPVHACRKPYRPHLTCGTSESAGQHCNTFLTSILMSLQA